MAGGGIQAETGIEVGRAIPVKKIKGLGWGAQLSMGRIARMSGVGWKGYLFNIRR